MVKLKHPRRISLPTIDTDLPFLGFQDEFPNNLPTGSSRSLGLLDVLLFIRLIMFPAKGCLTSNTIGLPPIYSFWFESSQRFNGFTSRASPVIHAVMEYASFPQSCHVGKRPSSPCITPSPALSHSSLS